MQPAVVWKAPVCTTVSGLPSVRFVRDGVAAANVDFVRNASASSLAVSNQPNVLYATYLEHLYESRDAGCTWTRQAELGPVMDSGWYLVLARADRQYVHDRVSLAEVTAAGIRRVPMPARMLRVAVDPANHRHLRAIAFDGSTYDSGDAGESWTKLGDAARYSLYSVAVDPTNFDHLAGSAFSEGIVVSFDGGRTWTRTGALTNVNVFYTEFSPADSRVVWSVGVSPQDGQNRLYRSIDGGMTFAPVLTSTGALQFSRADLSPHPTLADVVVFASGNGIGLYDHSTGSGHVLARFPSRTFAWSPAGTLYFAAPDEIVIIN